MSQLERQGDCLRLTGEVDFANASGLARQLTDDLQPGISALDCRAVTQGDSSLVALLILARKTAKARGLELQINGLNPSATRLIELYGVEALI